MREKKGTVDGLKIAIVGDIIHSRVARSNIFALRHFDSEIVCCGPPTMLPPHIEELGVKVEYNLKSHPQRRCYNDAQDTEGTGRRYLYPLH